MITIFRFVKQNELELRQRHEHSKMFRDFEISREEEIRALEDDLRTQMDKAVKEAIYKMDQGINFISFFQECLHAERKYRSYNCQYICYIC